MKRLYISLAVFMLFVAPTFAQAPVFSPGDALGWDYPDADTATYQVSRFEAQYDNGAWVAVGMDVAGTANGITTYKTTPAVTNGTHSVVVRACNVSGCGGASSPFAFAVLTAPASAPTNLRKIGG